MTALLALLPALLVLLIFFATLSLRGERTRPRD